MAIESLLEAKYTSKSDVYVIPLLLLLLKNYFYYPTIFAISYYQFSLFDSTVVSRIENINIHSLNIYTVYFCSGDYRKRNEYFVCLITTAGRNSKYLDLTGADLSENLTVACLRV